MTHDVAGRPDLEVAISAALAGAAVLQAMYGAELEQRFKTETDFATAADLAAEQAILEVIRTALPDDGCVGEESGRVSAGTGSRVWLVDPLCGTLNFAARTPLFSVNVALTDAGSTTVAAVSHPPSGELYWSQGDEFGILGRGASWSPPPNTLVDINGDGPLDRPFVGAQLGADPDFRARFSPRVESTTLALAWVAAGQRAGYVTDGMHRESVHFAAGIALCRTAGCLVTDFDGNPVHTGPGIVAASDPETHSALLRLVAKHRAG
jgi:myo-inositol-1(or 4)-monophosphatase